MVIRDRRPHGLRVWPSFPAFFLDDHRTGPASNDQSPALLEGSGMQHRRTEKLVQGSGQKQGALGRDRNGQDLQTRKSGGDREWQEELVHVTDGT